MKNKKGALALPWEKLVWWLALFLFAFFVLWFYGDIRKMIVNIIKSFGLFK